MNVEFKYLRMEYLDGGGADTWRNGYQRYVFTHGGKRLNTPEVYFGWPESSVRINLIHTDDADYNPPYFASEMSIAFPSTGVYGVAVPSYQKADRIIEVDRIEIGSGVEATVKAGDATSLLDTSICVVKQYKRKLITPTLICYYKKKYTDAYRPCWAGDTAAPLYEYKDYSTESGDYPMLIEPDGIAKDTGGYVTFAKNGTAEASTKYTLYKDGELFTQKVIEYDIGLESRVIKANGTHLFLTEDGNETMFANSGNSIYREVM